ncbi:MAG: hypothetical protein FJ187_06355 [Gammaproteobacteria bacterium]|nr:hypothetical protein [Gammaproteobacteria bacterium]
MPTTLQFRRYNTAATANVTGANGEITIDTEKDTVVVHDGSTAGGYPLVRDGAASISDTFGNLRKIPQSGSDKSSAYTLVANDVGRLVVITTSGSVVVPNSVFASGDVISVFNNTSSNITMTTNPVNTFLSGNNTSRTSINVSTRGIATILYLSSNTCVITGSVV